MPATPPQTPTSFNPALLLVDLQVDFSPSTPTSTDSPGALPVPYAPSTVPPILSLLALPFPIKIFTKDSHPPNHISFAANHPSPNNQPFTSFTTITHPSDPTQSMSTRLWPNHCVRGTPGWEFISEIKQWVEDPFAGGASRGKVVVVEKGQDPRIEMYSAFEDPFDGTIARGSPSLEAVLRANGVTDVYVAGLAGDYCVKETVLHCGLKGFRTWVVREGVASVDEGEDGWGQSKRAMEAVGGGGLVEVVGVDSLEVGWVRQLALEGVEREGEGDVQGEEGDLQKLGEKWVGDIEHRRLSLLAEGVPEKK